MKKLNSNGFSAVAVLLVILIIGAIAGAGWYVYSNTQQNNNTTNQNTGNEATQIPEDFRYPNAEVPSKWKTYVNGKYGFSFRYPDDQPLKTYENDFSKEQSNINTDRAVFDGGVTYTDSQGGYGVRVLQTSLERAVANDNLLANDNAYKNTIEQETVYKNGLKGTKLSYEPDGKKVAWFFIEGNNGLTYKFEVVEESGINKVMSETIYNSFKITK